jgi:hypothetical protein
MTTKTLIDYFENLIPLKDDEKFIVQSVFKERRIKRRQFILQEGDICKYNTFIVEGCFRMYLIDKKGKEHNLLFAVENWWIGDIGSFHANEPSRLYVEALEKVGRPTKSKGYLEGMTLHHGRISKDTGGGLCQLGNLLYWMALHTPLTIKERWRHGYDVFPDISRTIPFACGATLSYNYIDLQLENNTDKRFQIRLWLDKENLNGEITCDTDLKSKYEIYETDHLFKQQWWGGYTRHNKIWKKITSLVDGQMTEELVTENNAIMMYNPLLDK